MNKAFDSKINVDVLIIGGGLTGAALMMALMSHGYDVLLVDASQVQGTEPRPSVSENLNFDARTLALSSASIKILSQLQVWPQLIHEISLIKTIHVSQQGQFGITELKAEPGEALGAVIELQHIGRALKKLLPSQNILAPAKVVALDKIKQVATITHNERKIKIKAKLFVAADGGQSTVRQWSILPATSKFYNQHALVANIGLQRVHDQCAYERFTRNGPLAMLPMTERRAAMVWCLPPAEAKRMQEIDDVSFLKHLQLAFGYRLGRLVKVGQRSIFPLQEIIMPKQVEWPLVFVGNAAHTLHPVAGQGFNLGLRDIASLAQCIVRHGLNKDMLDHYQTMRHTDQTAITRGTDFLVSIFGSQIPGLGLARSFGLLALDNISVLQQLLARYAGGYGGVIPDLACGISLEQRS